MRGSSVSAILSAVYVGWSIAPYPGAQPGPLLLRQPPALGQLAMVVPVLTTAATAGAGAPILPALAATTAVTHLDSRAIAVARVLQRRQTASAITMQPVSHHHLPAVFSTTSSAGRSVYQPHWCSQPAAHSPAIRTGSFAQSLLVSPGRGGPGPDAWDWQGLPGGDGRLDLAPVVTAGRSEPGRQWLSNASDHRR
eukprot:COSAG06_NODE_212_length_20143_cov_16.516713_12_plen_195_part_00